MDEGLRRRIPATTANPAPIATSPPAIFTVGALSEPVAGSPPPTGAVVGGGGGGGGVEGGYADAGRAPILKAAIAVAITNPSFFMRWSFRWGPYVRSRTSWVTIAGPRLPTQALSNHSASRLVTSRQSLPRKTSSSASASPSTNAPSGRGWTSRPGTPSCTASRCASFSKPSRK